MRTREQIENEMLERKIGVEARDGNIRAELGSAIANELMLETLLDIRELLMKEEPANITPGCICYDLLGKINPNCPFHNPVSEKDSVEEARKACGCDNCMGFVNH